MLKTHWRVISSVERLLDNLIICACFFLTYSTRPTLVDLYRAARIPFPDEFQTLAPVEDYLIILGISLPLFNALLSIFGAYRSMRLSSYWWLVRQIALSVTVVFLLMGSILFLLKLDLSRSFLASFCLLSGLGILLIRVAVLAYLRRLRAHGKNFRNLLIVGTGKQAKKVANALLLQNNFGVKVLGFVTFGGDSASAVYDLGPRVIADPTTFEATLKKFAVDEVIFTDVFSSAATVQQLAEMAADEGVRVTLLADFFSMSLLQSDVSYLGELPLIHYNIASVPEDLTALVLKRIFDFMVSAALIILFAPLMLVLSLLIKLESRGPILYRQRRVGLNGRLFTLLKFRSMVEGADKMLADLKDKNEMSGPAFKLSADPRVTPIGRCLRRYSLDELPQLFNVLRGDMSLVGPRPPLPEEVSHYQRKQRRRLSMRPGITCIWQVSGRNEIADFQTWAELDLQYIDNWTFWGDLVLLARTLPAVVSGQGAR